MAVPIGLLLAVAAGVRIVVQQGLNNNLRLALNSAVWSGLVCYLVGTLCIVLLAVVLRDPLPTSNGAARIS